MEINLMLNEKTKKTAPNSRNFVFQKTQANWCTIVMPLNILGGKMPSRPYTQPQPRGI